MSAEEREEAERTNAARADEDARPVSPTSPIDPAAVPDVTTVTTVLATGHAASAPPAEPPVAADPMPPVTPPPDEPAVELDAQGRRVCGAKTRDGGRCGQPAMGMGKRCRLHGGMTPQARKATRLKLAELVDPAIAQLARLMVNGKTDQVKLRAAEAILDRAGHPRASRIEASVETHDARDLLVERLRALRAERGEIEPPRPAPAEDVVDAEVVVDAPPLVSAALAESAAEALAGRLSALKAERAAATEWVEAEAEPVDEAEPVEEPKPLDEADPPAPPVEDAPPYMRRSYGRGVRSAASVAEIADMLERARQR